MKFVKTIFVKQNGVVPFFYCLILFHCSMFDCVQKQNFIKILKGEIKFENAILLTKKLKITNVAYSTFYF